MNGQFPAKCANLPAGSVCIAVCDKNYTAAGSPTSMCAMSTNINEAPSWTTPQPALCVKGSVTTGTAFISSDSDYDFGNFRSSVVRKEFGGLWEGMEWDGKGEGVVA